MSSLETPKSPYDVIILNEVDASGGQVQTFQKTLRIRPATNDVQRNIQDCLNGLTKLASPRAPIEVKFDDKDFIVTSPYFAQGNIVNYLDAFIRKTAGVLFVLYKTNKTNKCTRFLSWSNAGTDLVKTGKSCARRRQDFHKTSKITFKTAPALGNSLRILTIGIVEQQ
ncbi:hypothetical protein PLICRDRAFT_172195 [Plicaturopsis crispa FD-325 SS-3]|nr:hypothetical protein PLICRDRAFT_172195 [Plicaturopsis crispa FD-325 SS-3]